MAKSISPVITVRPAAILTNSYVYGTKIQDQGPAISGTTVVQSFSVLDSNQLQLIVDFTIGSLTTCEISVEQSLDGTTWAPISAQAVDTAVPAIKMYSTPYQLLGTGKYQIATPVTARYIRIGSKGTGTVTNSSLAIKAELMYV